MKKTNRFAMLALVGGVLASALVMGCGGGTDESTESTSGSMNGASNGGVGANGASSNGAGSNAASSNAAR